MKRGTYYDAPRAREEMTVKERPILFSAPMVRAILDGRKTQTRRIVGPRREAQLADMVGVQPWTVCPYGAPGDRLWVRETWGLRAPFDLTDWDRESIVGRSAADLLEMWEIDYRADWQHDHEPAHWRPSIHMPRWASRILLEVTDVRVERLQSITEADAEREGFDAHSLRGAKAEIVNTDGTRDEMTFAWTSSAYAFSTAWANLYGNDGPTSWASSPWVWVVSFKRAESAARAA